MTFILGFIVVLFLLYVIGQLIYQERREQKYAFVKVFGVFFSIMFGNLIVMLPTFLASLMLISIFDSSSQDVTGMKIDTGFFLMFILIVILLTAIFHYLFRNKLLYKKTGYKLTEEEYEICEYFIQWMTIYIVVYQFLFDGLKELIDLIVDKQLAAKMFDVMLSPNNLNFVIQPLLIATWIVVVMEKYRVRHANDI